MQIERDRVVLFHYTLKGEDGDEVGSSPDEHPVAVLQGHGHIIPGLETALAGHSAGDEFQVTLPPDSAELEMPTLRATEPADSLTKIVPASKKTC